MIISTTKLRKEDLFKPMKYIVTLNGKKYEVDVTDTTAEVLSITDAHTNVHQPMPAHVPAPIPNPAPAPVSPAVIGGTRVVAPMPGNIVRINVSIGQEVKSGEVLAVLESMKMENDITAPCSGTVADIRVKPCSSVNADDVLIIIS